MATAVLWLVFLTLPLMSRQQKTAERDGTRGRSQYEVNCHPCQTCNKTTVVCDNTHLLDTDMLLQFTDLLYPELDTLHIRGNKFGDIEAQNLFGMDVRHEKLTNFYFADNGVTKIDGRAFHGMPHLEELDLSNNELEGVTGDLFGNMYKLRDLKLSNALDLSLTATKKADLLHKLLTNTTNKFAELQFLNLANNGLVYVPEDLFCRMPALEQISLRGNQLSSFNVFNASCLPGLIELDLSDNQLTLINPKLTKTFDNLVHLQSIDVSGNEFNCNCHLNDFVQWVCDNVKDDNDGANIGFKNVEDTTCMEANPDEFVGQSLAKLTPGSLRCPQDETSYLHTVYIFISLALIALCLLFACLIYSNRGTLLKNRKRFGIGKATFRIPGGYKRLDREPEVKAELV